MLPELGRNFIGRHSELAALQAALAQAAAGRPRIVLLAGEPGIGKTRTAQELVAHAGTQQVLAIWGRCPEEPGAPPYWPWLQLLRRYAALRGEGASAVDSGAAAQQIAALDPASSQQGTESAAPVADADALKARFRLFDAITAFWQHAAERQPLLLVLDDLHRADVPSLRLLEFVMAEAVSSRLMVLGTYRDQEVTHQHPLAGTLAQLHRHAQVQRLLLGGFSAQETAQFVAAAGVASSELAAVLHDQTEGHPLFLTELARDMLQPGQAPQAGDGRTIGAVGSMGSMPSPRRVPKGVRGAIGQRLSQLSAPCLAVLQQAAVIGRLFAADLLCRLGDDRPIDHVLAALREAQTASLIDETAEPGVWQFSHALVRDALYDELPAAQRAALHQCTVQALEAMYPGELTPWLSALAHHSHAAAGVLGDMVQAVDYATRAAERATATQAHEEAARHYRLACSMLPGSDDAQRGKMLLRLGEAQNSAGDSAQALLTFAEAAACARRLADASLLAHAAIGFGNAQWRQGIDGSRAVLLIREALALAPPGDTRDHVLLQSALCRALLFANQPAVAETAYRSAVAMARRMGDPLTLFGALTAIVPGRWYPEGLDLRIAAAREALALMQTSPDMAWPIATFMGWHTGDLMEAGETAGAAAAARSHLAEARANGEPFNAATAMAALTMIATHEGRFAEAEPLALETLQCGERFDRANAAGLFGVQMFTLRRHQGRLRELAPVLRQFLASQDGPAIWRPGLAVLHAELGAREEARELFESLARGGFAAIAHDAIRIASLAYLAEVCVWLDDPARAAVLYPLLLPYARRNIVFGAHTASFGAAARLLGMLAHCLQQWDVAQAHFEFALELDERSGGRPWLAWSRHEFAALLMHRGRAGDLERAQLLRQAALQDAQELGLRGLQERLAAMPLSARSSPPSSAVKAGTANAARAVSASPVAGLTPRELQVLQLVAAGKTNQQIARALHRSPATVAIHVRNILGKAQVANRAEAAAFAVRHGLVAPE